MAATYKKIASVTVGSGGTSFIEFTSIDQTYTDLILKTSIRNSAANGYDNIQVSFNGAPSGSAYSARNLADYVTGVLSQTSTGASSFLYLYSGGANATASTFASSEFYLPNYAGSTNKSISADSATESNSASAYTSTRAMGAGLWSSTAAITSIRLTPNSGTWVEFTTATLYGISNS